VRLAGVGNKRNVSYGWTIFSDSTRGTALPRRSGAALGPGQYRNAVASGQSRNLNNSSVIDAQHSDPTLPRYGTDPVQQ